MNEKKLLIESIKSEYLVEKNKTHSAIKSMWSQYQKMGKELSEGIYASDDHFIYELIQNAEDTESKEEVHTLEFVLEDNGLVVINNEIGFNEEQIKAICAFGQSTKSLDKNKGFIGEKGIGFKSVFKITDKPAIYSNGYKFYFRRFGNDDKTEYIIPHWIDNDELKAYPQKFQNNTHTALYLPFNTSKKTDSLTKLRDNIKQIEPILLLFLNRLESIKIFENNRQLINTTKSSKKVEKIQVVTITNNQQKNKYYTFKKLIQVDQTVDEVANKDGRRKDVKEREIILAFPDTKNDTREDRVFAFLPTNLRSRLNFIIQADFILQSGRENIAIDSEWNDWQLDEIKCFITDGVIPLFQQHSKLRMSYMNYFIRNGESDNILINEMYDSLLDSLEDMSVVLGSDSKWYKPKNIVLLEDGVNIDNKYIKMLYGNQFQQLNYQFELPQDIIRRFNIKYLSKQNIIEKITSYFLNTKLNDLHTDDVFDLTVFLSKYSSVDSRSREYDKKLFLDMKNALPIIPKYLHSSKFYYAKNIYLSEEYTPDFYLELLVDESSCDFKYFNFLSPRYFSSESKGVEKFILKILDELKEDNNKKTIEFMSKYPDYLSIYLSDNIEKHYKKVFDFLLENMKDNKDRISNIPLIQNTKDEFYSGKDEDVVYFDSSNIDKSLNILHSELDTLSRSNNDYRELLVDIFNVKEADIHNIILHEYLPWFVANRVNRSLENDTLVIEYTKQIVEHFDEFDREQRDEIKNKLVFISSNDKNKYMKASFIYLTTAICNEYLHVTSIEDYLNDKSLFDFLDEKYNSIFESIERDSIVNFLNVFKFLKNEIIEGTLKNFLNSLNSKTSIEDSIQTLKLILDSPDFNTLKNKLNLLEKLELYSEDNKKFKITNMLLDQVPGLSIPYLNSAYSRGIDFSQHKRIHSYFQSRYKIEPLIEELQHCNDIEKAIQIYEYMDKVSSDSITGHKDVTITVDKIKVEFHNKPLIYDNDGFKHYPRDVVWTGQKSESSLIALAEIFPSTLQNFFLKKVQISQHRGIKQIVEHIYKIEDRNQEYFNLLVDLGQLMDDDNEISNYIKSFKTPPTGKYSNNIHQNIKMFLAEDEKIFIVDNGRKIGSKELIINDLNVDVPAELEEYILTLEFYGRSTFDNLVSILNLKCLSQFSKIFEYEQTVGSVNIKEYRRILHFAYDLLFTKYYEEYQKLADRELNNLNDIVVVKLVDSIEAQIIVNDFKIIIDNEKYFLGKNELILTDKNYISKAIADILGYVSDKDIKDFINEVIEGHITEEAYYLEEGIERKQNFYLEISDITPKQVVPDFDEGEITDNEENIPNIPENKSPSHEYNTPEEEQQKQKSGREQIEGYQNDIDGETINTDPVAAKNRQDNINKTLREQESAVTKAHSKRTSKKASTTTKSKVPSSTIYRNGEEETKEFFKRKDQYAGCCQVCGFTFKTKNTGNYCERFTWTDGKKNMTVADLIFPGNSLCLCAKCNSIILGGGDFKASFLEEINRADDVDDFVEKFRGKYIESCPDVFEGHIDFDDMYALPIRLNNSDEYIYFTDEHLIQFFTFLESKINISHNV